MTDVLRPAKSFIILPPNSPSSYRAGRDARCNLITRYPDDHSTPRARFSLLLVQRLSSLNLGNFGREEPLTLITSHTTRTWVHLRQPGSNAIHSTPQKWKQTNPIDRIEGSRFFLLFSSSVRTLRSPAFLRANEKAV
jgi:hypothetical protein